MYFITNLVFTYKIKLFLHGKIDVYKIKRLNKKNHKPSKALDKIHLFMIFKKYFLVSKEEKEFPDF